ncbi:hypothetical protein J6590_046328 [Homalodisca vitripennis]|nr:hypothetical protein J6590_046328 [Homalodisca vitripennis]
MPLTLMREKLRPLLGVYSEGLRPTATNCEIRTATHTLDRVIEKSNHSLPLEHRSDYHVNRPMGNNQLILRLGPEYNTTRFIDFWDENTNSH